MLPKTAELVGGGPRSQVSVPYTEYTGPGPSCTPVLGTSQAWIESPECNDTPEVP